ncbi:cohesin subunit SA-2-like isoform X3 [Leptonychotes weddellii]|uniref:Cohesin subunit SA-2-like isoform X3 n=1 Tax=Leptonychotes weddellii TaxID=9713 RepID=A0A7F8QBR4_LEPWE|nr:cohesin subunit SA-2-like isoform X3 [Leptonychotes weddellii]
MLVAAVRQAAEGRPPAGRRLGKKFAADKEKVTPLLQIPQYCNLDVYDMDGLGSYLDAALLELDCLVQRHSDVAVLEACARAYGTYCDEGGSAHCQAAPACSRLVDMLVDVLTPLLDVFIQREKQGLFLGHGEMGRICSTLRRLAAFYSAHDLSSWNLYEKMDSLLTFRRHQGSLPTEVVHCALQCTYYALLWQIVAATDRLPPQVGDGRGGGQVWSAVVWEEGKMERDRAVIAALTGVRPHHWLASVLPGSGQGSWTLT